MMDFNFHMPVRIISGWGAVREHADVLRELGSRCVIVTGGSSAQKSGALDDVKTALEQAGISYRIFSGIGANPLVSACDQAGALARDSGADFLIGIGGGSPMDAAKAAAVYAANPELSGEEIYAYTPEAGNAPLPVVLVGTTAGTGSEVSAVAVLTRDSDGRKKSISGPWCFAHIAFADPAYTCSVPYGTTVSTALDALSHTVEGMLNPRIGEVIRMFGHRALQLIGPALVRMNREHTLPDRVERERLYYGSLYAGVVLAACGTAFPHPMGYVLTEDYGIPHGRACAAFLPSLVAYAQVTAPEAVAEVLGALKMTFEEFKAVVDGLAAIEVHMDDQTAQCYAARWPGLKNFENTPGGYDERRALDLLRHLFVQEN